MPFRTQKPLKPRFSRLSHLLTRRNHLPAKPIPPSTTRRASPNPRPHTPSLDEQEQEHEQELQGQRLETPPPAPVPVPEDEEGGIDGGAHVEGAWLVGTAQTGFVVAGGLVRVVVIGRR
jgi:hypothetical protein